MALSHPASSSAKSLACGHISPVRGFEQRRSFHRTRPACLPCELDVVGRERLAAVLKGEALGLQPHGHLPPGKGLLPVEPPVQEPGVPQGVQDPGGARGEEGAAQVLLAVAQQRGVEAEDVLRTAPSVLALLVGPVLLGVVVLPPRVVRPREVRERLRFGEVPVCHPFLDAERRLYVGLVRPSPLDLLFGYAQSPLDGLGLVGLEDAPAVGDEPLGRCVPLPAS
jgi:hypothetical protein